jgi:hypothetical protein
MFPERHRDCYFDISLFKDFTPQVLSLRIYGTLNPHYPSKKNICQKLNNRYGRSK